MRSLTGAFVVVALLASGCGDDAPDTQWDEAEVIQAAGLTDAGGPPGLDGLVVADAGDAKCTVEAVATNADEVSQLDDQTNVSVAVNADETAGVSVRDIVDEGESIDSPEFVHQQDEDECVTEIEDGLADLTEDQ